MAQDTEEARHEELLALRNDKERRERRFYGASADKEIVKEPVYDVKTLDRVVTRVAREIRLLDHPHALKGAIVSLAVMWRIPVIHARDPEDSLRVLRFLGQQLAKSDAAALRRYDRKPKRLASRKLYVLQGLPGVGPALSNRLLRQFGSVENVMTAAESMLVQVRGIGPQKAPQIKRLVSAA